MNRSALLFIVFIYLAGCSVQKPMTILSVRSVYDGDTFKVDLQCPNQMDIFCEDIPIRVAGVDTPEIKGKCDQEKALAVKAKAFTQAFLLQGKISLLHPKRGKYFRVVADVFVNGESLSETLIRNHLGVAYDGGKKAHRWRDAP